MITRVSQGPQNSSRHNARRFRLVVVAKSLFVFNWPFYLTEVFFGRKPCQFIHLRVVTHSNCNTRPPAPRIVC